MKANKAQVQTRVEEVLRIRLDGAEFWDVREYAREKEREAGSVWELPPGGKPLSDGQLWRYIGRADRLIAESCRASRQKLLRRHLAQRRNLFAKAVSAGDYRAALAVARAIAPSARVPPRPGGPPCPHSCAAANGAAGAIIPNHAFEIAKEVPARRSAVRRSVSIEFLLCSYPRARPSATAVSGPGTLFSAGAGRAGCCRKRAINASTAGPIGAGSPLRFSSARPSATPTRRRKVAAPKKRTGTV
jgi:hypothetical protein